MIYVEVYPSEGDPAHFLLAVLDKSEVQANV